MEATFDELDEGKVCIHYVDQKDIPKFRMLWEDDAVAFLSLSDDEKQEYYNTQLKG
ncbi:MAG: hypothetical protein ACPGDA_10595 [Paracoccaceae bacterium]